MIERNLEKQLAAQEQLLTRTFANRYIGGSCLVVGGGGSIISSDVRCVQEGASILTNVALWHPATAGLRKRAVAGVILDPPLLRRMLVSLVRECAGIPIFTGNTLGDTAAVLDLLKRLSIFRIPSNHTVGLGHDFATFVNGGNSGFAAIQLALIMGFDRIGLVGFDGSPKRTPSAGTSGAQAKPSTFDGWLRQLNSYADMFAALGVSLVRLGCSEELSSIEKIDSKEWNDLAGGMSRGPRCARAIELATTDARVAVPYVPVNPPSGNSVGRLRRDCFAGATDYASTGYRPLHERLVARHESIASIVGASERRSQVGSGCDREPDRNTSVIRIFIGTEPLQRDAESVLAYSIAKHTTPPFHIEWLSLDERREYAEWDIGRERGRRPTRDMQLRDLGTWYTDFSLLRWTVPEVCGYAGRALYLDVDTLVLGDLRDLWCTELTGPLAVIDEAETSVMLLDCARFRVPLWPSIEEMKRGRLSLEDCRLKALALGPTNRLEAKWNCLDGEGLDESTGILHFTRLASQPWRPYIGQVEYECHRRPEVEALWFKYAAKAFASGYFASTAGGHPKAADTVAMRGAAGGE